MKQETCARCKRKFKSPHKPAFRPIIGDLGATEQGLQGPPPEGGAMTPCEACEKFVKETMERTGLGENIVRACLGMADTPYHHALLAQTEAARRFATEQLAVRTKERDDSERLHQGWMKTALEAQVQRDEALAALKELADVAVFYPDFKRLVHAKAEARRILAEAEGKK